MSVEAVAWAFRQELPPVPKLVLIALCERANSETGQCWPGIEVIARAVCMSERSVVTYIAALVRNGFVEKQAMRRKNGQRRTNHYWILFDRTKGPWTGPGGKVEELPLENDQSEAPAETESQPCANPAHGDNVQTDSHGPHATACTLQMEPEPEEIEPSESESLERAARERQSVPPQGFAPDKRKREIARAKAADEARKPKSFPVIEGSEPWEAWMTQPDPRTGKIHSRTLTCTIKLENGRLDRGWYFPTLWPKPDAQAGPPTKPLDPAFKRTG